MARRIGVMGGTFDPIHHGHLVAASEAQSWFDLDEVVFVPTGEPWQKADRDVSPAEHRYLMTVIATASNPRFTVSRVDIERGGRTYTIDTLRDLQEVYRGDDLYFITGADAMAAILSWRDHSDLFELAHFVGCTRPGHVMDRDALTGLPKERITLVEIPALAISSTECRQRVEAGEPVWYLVPDGVVQHIAKYDLYRENMTATEQAIGLARAAAAAADDKQAANVVAFDVSEQLALTDVFVICSADSDPQVRAIYDAVEKRMNEEGIKALRREGEREGRWILLDFGDIIVHILRKEDREFYALERLWNDCPAVDLRS